MFNKIFHKKNNTLKETLKETLKVCPMQLEFKQNDIFANAQKIIECLNTIDADLFVCPTLALNGGAVNLSALDGNYVQQIVDACKQISISAQLHNKAVIVSYAEIGNNTEWRAAGVWLQDGGFRHIFHSLAVDGKLSALNYKDANILVTLDQLDDAMCSKMVSPEQKIDLIIMMQRVGFGYSALHTSYRKNYQENTATDESAQTAQNIIVETNNKQLSIKNHDAYYLEQLDVTQKVAKTLNTNVLAVNMVGTGNIVSTNVASAGVECVFSGSSCAFNQQGKLVYLAPSLLATDFINQPNMQIVDWHKANLATINDSDHPFYQNPEIANLYNALVVSVRCYVEKNKLNGVVLGLSGGIDSALVLAIAVDALGADKVHALMLPYLYTSDASKEDATHQAARLGVKFDVIAINSAVDVFTTSLKDIFVGYKNDVTEENLQARCRAVILMAIANKKNLLLLCTGNKSELATGYCTLYGDMAGGFAPLKDIFKTTVYELAKYRNNLANYEGELPIIAQRVIVRAPSAELAPNQTDQDVLPPYAQLDEILNLILNFGYKYTDFENNGNYQLDVANKIYDLIKKGEFKRIQAATGPIISSRTF